MPVDQTDDQTESNPFPSLPTGWECKPLGELVERVRGISYGVVQPGKPDSSGVPIVRVNNIKSGRVSTGDVLTISKQVEENYGRTRLRGGEVLLTLVGTLGECAVVPTELQGWNVARAVGVIPVASPIDPKWVEICLRTKHLQHLMKTWATTTVQATLNLRDVAKLPVPLPPKSVRESITKVLSDLEDKIELNRRTNETLEAMVRTLFRSWFVDFDPVRAKADGQTPPGLDAATAKLFPDSFEPSTLGPIPKGWRVGNLGDVATNPRRGVAPKDVQPETPYIGLEHMPRKSICLGEWGCPEELASGKFQFDRGDILFGKLRPYFHKVGVAPVDGICSTDILVITPKQPEWFGFVLGHVSSDEVVAHTDAASTGTKMPRTNWSDIARYSVVVPSIELAERLTKQIDPLIQLIRENVLQSCTLAATRDALLPKLLSGEVRVNHDNTIEIAP